MGQTPFEAKPKVRSWRRLLVGRKTAKSLALPGHFLHWLGIDAEALEQSLGRRSSRSGFSCFSWVRGSRDVPKHFFDGAEVENDREFAKPRDSCFQEAVNYATCVQSDTLPCEWTQAELYLNRRWQDWMETAFQETLSFFQQRHPDLVVLVQGLEPQNAVARVAAQSLEIPFLAVENTARSDRFVWDTVTGLTTRNAAQSYYWRHKNRFPENLYQEYCDRMICDTKRLKSAEHRSPENRESTSDSASLETLVSGRPYVLFLGQVYTDASQVFGMRRWASPMEVLRSVVSWCQQNDYRLVLKLHPKETFGVNPVDNRPYDCLTYRKIFEDAGLVEGLQNLHAVIDRSNRFDTYRLIEHAAIAVTVNSQSGLEAAIRGVPVVVCGEASFSGLDFTFDAPHAEYFSAAMNLASGSTESTGSVESATERTALAREFAYIYYEHFCRPKTLEGFSGLIQEVLR